MAKKATGLVNADVARVQRVKSHVFRGKRYKIQVAHILKSEEAHGLCTDPRWPDKTITIDPDQHGQRLLQSLIDESLHACDWNICNEAVEEMAESISKFLYKVGYRLPKKEKRK